MSVCVRMIVCASMRVYMFVHPRVRLLISIYQCADNIWIKKRLWEYTSMHTCIYHSTITSPTMTHNAHSSVCAHVTLFISIKYHHYLHGFQATV